MRLFFVTFTALSFTALSLVACGAAKKEPLPGERISLFQATASSAAVATTPTDTPAPTADAVNDTGAILPDAWTNQFWPQNGGFANHAMRHLNGGASKTIWSSSIGRGSSKTLPLTAPPIAAEGKIYALNGKADVVAVDAQTGKDIFTTSVIPAGEDDAVVGGGLAYAGGRLFVTAGFREVRAHDPKTGTLIWRVKLPNAARSAPTAMPDRVYVTTVDNQTVAIAADTGKVLWTQSGLAAETGLLGGANPAANETVVVPVYSSGEIYVLSAENGSTLWTDTLSSLTAKGIATGTTDIRALPVLDGTQLVATSVSGTLVNYDMTSGKRLWSANVGGSQTPWLAGNRVYVVGRADTLTAVNAADGTVLWSQKLTGADNVDDKRDWFGPVLVNGALYTVSNAGDVVVSDPATGQVTSTRTLDVKPIAAPIVANQMMFVLGANGTLVALQ